MHMRGRRIEDLIVYWVMFTVPVGLVGGLIGAVLEAKWPILPGVVMAVITVTGIGCYILGFVAATFAELESHWWVGFAWFGVPGLLWLLGLQRGLIVAAFIIGLKILGHLGLYLWPRITRYIRVS